MKKLLIFAFIALFAIGGLWFGRSAYRGHKEKRAMRQAEQFLQQKEFAKAMLSARQALQLNENNLGACRVMATLAESSGSRNALGWRKRIAQLEPTVDNKLILASCALRFESAPYPTAASTLREISASSTNKAEFHIVLGKLSLLLSDFDKAEKHLSEAARLEPENDSNQLNLAALQMRSSDSSKAERARRTLERLRSNPQFEHDALRWLLRDREEHGDYVAALDYSAALLRSPKIQDPDRFQHLTLLHRTKSPGLGAYLQSLREKAGTNAVEIYKIASWQIASEMSAEAISWLDTLSVSLQAERPIPIARAEAMAALKQWSELTDYLRSQKWNEQDFLRLALLAHSLKEQGEDAVAQANWSRAVRTATESGEHLAVLAQLAGKWGWESETESLLWTITENFADQAWALESLNRVYEANKNTAGLLRVYEVRAKRNGTDQLSKNNVAMISLLLKTNLPSAYRLAEEVYLSNKTNHGFVSTYAFSLHAQGKTKEALTLMEGLEEADLLRPDIAFYHGLLLRETGQREKAKAALSLARVASLLPEEKRLLEKARE